MSSQYQDCKIGKQTSLPSLLGPIENFLTNSSCGVQGLFLIRRLDQLLIQIIHKKKKILSL